MVYYEAVIGSRCYDLELPDSDIDVVMVSEDLFLNSHHCNVHTIQIPKKCFIDRVIYKDRYPYSHQYLFPSKILSSGPISDLILEVREDLILANLPTVWDVHFHQATVLSMHTDVYYNAFPKRIAYSTLLFDLLAKYADGSPFSKAIKPDTIFKKSLLSMRCREMPVKDAIYMNNEAKHRAIQASEFYNRKVNRKFIDEVRAEMNSIMFSTAYDTRR